LDKKDRNYLVRKVSSNQQAQKRQDKLINLPEIDGKLVLIDGYNVLITSESVLYHPESVLKSDDGVLRDVKSVFGKYKPHHNTEPTLNLLLDTLKSANPREIRFYYDSPVSLSGELAHLTRKLLKEKKVNGCASTHKHVDRDLVKTSQAENGVVATSDGPLIDHLERVVDLPGSIKMNKKSI